MKILELESKIQEGSENIDFLKRELERLKVLEFEESIKEDNEVQLLKG